MLVPGVTEVPVAPTRVIKAVELDSASKVSLAARVLLEVERRNRHTGEASFLFCFHLLALLLLMLLFFFIEIVVLDDLRKRNATVEDAVVQDPAASDLVGHGRGVGKADVVGGEAAIVHKKLRLVSDRVRFASRGDDQLADRTLRADILFVTPTRHVRAVESREALADAFLVEAEFFVLADELSLLFFLLLLCLLLLVEFNIKHEVTRFVFEGLLTELRNAPALCALQGFGDLKIGASVSEFEFELSVLGIDDGFTIECLRSLDGVARLLFLLVELSEKFLVMQNKKMMMIGRRRRTHHLMIFLLLHVVIIVDDNTRRGGNHRRGLGRFSEVQTSDGFGGNARSCDGGG